MRRNHRSGGKFSGHTTVNEAGIPVIDILETHVDVHRISIGIIERTGSSGNGIPIVSCRHTGTALEMKVRGNRYIQTFYIYTRNPKAVEDFLAERFPRPIKRSKNERGHRK